VTAAAAAPAGLRKAAILMVTLGEDAASAIFRHLAPHEVEKISEAIASLKVIDAETTLRVLEEFQRLVSIGDSFAKGGREYAQKLLVKAFGEEGAKEILRQAPQASEMTAARLDSLEEAVLTLAGALLRPAPRGPGQPRGDDQG